MEIALLTPSEKLFACGWSGVSDVVVSELLPFHFFITNFKESEFSQFFIFITLPELKICQKFAILVVHAFLTRVWQADL